MSIKFYVKNDEIILGNRVFSNMDQFGLFKNSDETKVGIVSNRKDRQLQSMIHVTEYVNKNGDPYTSIDDIRQLLRGVNPALTVPFQSSLIAYYTEIV